jgi:hypothetical protein
MSDVKYKHGSPFIQFFDSSVNEVQSFGSFKETESYLEENNQLREGPSSFTFIKDTIPESIIKRKDAIIIGQTDVYRSLVNSYNKKNHWWEEIMNMSPPFLPKYNDKFDESNHLLIYLHDVIYQIGHHQTPPVIIVEYYGIEYAKILDYDEFIQQCKNFIKTLAEAQKYYSGRIICVSPPPYWQLGSSLLDYQASKSMNRKVSEALSMIGYAFDIYVSSPLICSLPIYHHTYPDIVGYVCLSRFQQLPIFDMAGNYTAEAGRRAIHGLQEDLKRIRKLQVV